MSRRLTCSGGKIPAVQLAFEKRVCLRTSGPVLGNPADIVAFVKEHYGCKPQEVFLSLDFNARNELLSVHEVTLGGVDQAMVDPKVLFSGALLSGASAIVLVHNHPSGNPEPSQMDIALTQQLVQAARPLAIRILDHLVIGRGDTGYTSFAMKGLMPRALGGVDPEDSLDGSPDYGDEEITYGGAAPEIPIVSCPRRRW